MTRGRLDARAVVLRRRKRATPRPITPARLTTRSDEGSGQHAGGRHSRSDLSLGGDDLVAVGLNE